MVKNQFIKNLLFVFGLVLFFSWLVILPVRSAIYVIRIYGEFTKPVEGYYEEIKSCARNINLDTEEKIRYYKYVNFGVECEK